jgi:hypothetical protein
MVMVVVVVCVCGGGGGGVPRVAMHVCAIIHWPLSIGPVPALPPIGPQLGSLW